MKCKLSLNESIKRFDSSGIRDVFNKAASIPDIIPLVIGEPDLPIPALIKDCMRTAIRLDQTRYTPTEGIPELRELIRGQYAEYGFAEDVILTAGVSGAIDLLCRVLFEPRRKVVVLEPFFPMYVSQLLFVGAIPVIVRMTPDCWVDLEAVEDAVKNNALAIFVTSPNNPTGVVYSKEEIKGIAEIANKYGVLVISDDIYDTFSYDGEVPNFMGLAENLVALNGWSKSYSLTGSRIGYVAGPKWVIEAMAKAQQYSYVCANTVAQWAILQSWGQVDISDRKEIFRKRRDLVWETLRPHFSLPRPEGAFYAFVAMPPGVTGTEFASACLDQKVLVVPSGGTFTMRDSAVRISYALPAEQLQKGLEGMIAAKKALAGK